MPKKQNSLIKLLSGLLLFLSFVQLSAQEQVTQSSSLLNLLKALEEQFDIKFSYVDEDIAAITIEGFKQKSLEETLAIITQQTQIKIEKLNNRYYTLNKSKTVNVCAVVLDNFEQNTITGATVRILGTEMATVTDSNGKFSFTTLDRTASIQISHLGFKSLFIKAEKLANMTNCKLLSLTRTYQQLDEVVVYEFLTRGMIKQIDASFEINTEDFGILPGLSEPDILQSVQALPGIKSIDETVSDINIRGGTNDQNLILWDGIKMYQSGHFFGLISAFNPYLTDKVSVIKNGSSASYGDGVSGIIDLRTKNNLNQDFYGGAGFNLISGDFFGQLSLSDKIGIQFSARRSTTDFFNTPTFNTFFNRAFKSDTVNGNSTEVDNIEREDEFFFYDFSGKFLYDINEKQKFRLGFIAINNQLDFTESQVDENLFTSSALDQSNFSMGGTLNSAWSDSFSTTINTYYTQYNLNATNTSSLGQQVLFQGNRVAETSVKLGTTYKFNKEFSLINGIQTIQTKIDNTTEVSQPQVSLNQINRLNTNAIFSELKYENENLFAQIGVRINHYQNPDIFEKTSIEPRLTLNYALSDKLKVILLGEFKSQATNQVVDLEQNFLGIEKRRWTIADGLNLPVTQSKQGSLGLNYQAGGLYVGVEGFYKFVDGVSTETQGFQNQNQFNIDEGEIGSYAIKGVEFLINQKSKIFSLWASYTFNTNTYTFTNLTPPNFPNNLDIRHSATFGATYTYNSWRLGLGLNYRSGKPFTEPESVNTVLFPAVIIYLENNSSRLPEYVRADASIIYDFNVNENIKASLGASVLNFTNRENILNIYYQLDQNNEIEKVESSSLGITPNISFRVKF